MKVPQAGDPASTNVWGGFGMACGSGEVDGEAGGGALDAGGGGDVCGDGASEEVQVFGFDLDDEVVGAGDGVDSGDGGVFAVCAADVLCDGLCASDFGFDEDEAFDHGVVDSSELVCGGGGSVAGVCWGVGVGVGGMSDQLVTDGDSEGLRKALATTYTAAVEAGDMVVGELIVEPIR